MIKKITKYFIKFRNNIIKSKIFMQRTMSWISIINSGMILFLVLSKLQDYGINVHITKWFFPIFILTLISMLIIGYLEDKLGFHKEEQHLSAQRNPYFDKILNRLDDIENKLK